MVTVVVGGKVLREDDVKSATFDGARQTRPEPLGASVNQSVGVEQDFRGHADAYAMFVAARWIEP
jgi:hypothetical protein